ncbi:MAG TPA: asparagine synthase (glutamine-hydrolyzing) [Candidatus Brocadiia bacterium]|nr:asparagine synthase (glutamine-hydrolyzing) [Candidatus Brocadiia bacterium]
MCGICGFVGRRDPDLLKRMTDILAHRGPDDEGFRESDYASLGHRRLSIIDLATGRQPMPNEDGTIWTVFNGEIYNYRELRRQLEPKGHVFKTKSDTEAIVHAYEEWGTCCFEKFNGQWGIGIWDEPNRRLVLSRDRIGIRPVYYCRLPERFLFASELKSILECGDVPRDLDPAALNDYLSFRYVCTPHSMFKAARRLPPASFLVFEGGNLRIEPYWKLSPTPIDAKTPADCHAHYRELLQDSVAMRLIADVPLGAFLSGGIDSSSVVALMRKASNHPPRTFCIGFGTDIDETGKARRIAEFVGAEHSETVIGEESVESLEKIIWHLDEPLGDAIIMPIYFLAREARKQVKVVLTGEGADETMAGYVHQVAMNLGERFRRLMPGFMARGVVPAIIRGMPTALLNPFFPYPAALGRRGRDRLAAYFEAGDNHATAYLTLTTLFSPTEKRRLLAPEWHDSIAEAEAAVEAELSDALAARSPGDLVNRICDYDIKHWLQDNILFKQDRLSMAWGLEGRVPMLDHRIVEYCAGLPLKTKIRRMQGKQLLRGAMDGVLPPETVRAKKQAFYMPTEKVFGSAFEGYVRDILSEDAVRRRGILDPKAVGEITRRGGGGELLNNKQMMAILLLELWFRQYHES